MTATRSTKPAPAVETPAVEEAPAAAPRKTAHSDCTHEVTPAARAKCRAERAKAAVETA